MELSQVLEYAARLQAAREFEFSAKRLLGQAQLRLVELETYIQHEMLMALTLTGSNADARKIEMDAAKLQIALDVTMDSGHILQNEHVQDLQARTDAAETGRRRAEDDLSLVRAWLMSQSAIR